MPLLQRLKSSEARIFHQELSPLWCFQTGSGAVSRRLVCLLLGGWGWGGVPESMRSPRKANRNGIVFSPSLLLVFHKSILGEARGGLAIRSWRIHSKSYLRAKRNLPAPNTFSIYGTYNLLKEDHSLLAMITKDGILPWYYTKDANFFIPTALVVTCTGNLHQHPQYKEN